MMRKATGDHTRIKIDNKLGGGENEVEDESLEVVDLSCMLLDSLPDSSLNLSNIGKLDLSNNNLQIIAESVTARLLNLTELDLHSNQLKSLPNSIGCLSKLRVLNVAGNLLQHLPKTIESCRCLEEVNFNFNKLNKLPETVGFEWVNLKKLSVNSNKLFYLPQSITQITSLIVLDARLNNLKSLPEDMENLVNLQVLNVSQNFHHLHTLPCSVGVLPSLVELDISYNRIKVLPNSIGCLKKLHKFSVEGNPLESPPLEVAELGLHAIRVYLSEQMITSGCKSGSRKKSWMGKLVKYATFNGHPRKVDGDEGLSMHHYPSIDGLASPMRMRLFSPRRIFSPKHSLFR